MQKNGGIGKCCDCKGLFEAHQLLETMYYNKVCTKCAIFLCHDCGSEVSSLNDSKCPNCGDRKVRLYVISGNSASQEERSSRIEYALKRISDIYMQGAAFTPGPENEFSRRV